MAFKNDYANGLSNFVEECREPTSIKTNYIVAKGLIFEEYLSLNFKSGD